MSYEDSLSSRYLSSSISSLSSARAQTSWIARTYRQAAQLFLTRRLYEALSTIEPVLFAPLDDPDAISRHAHDDDGRPAAPVAAASKTTRVKVWSFYLTLLNSIIELGAEEGKLVFGSTKWRALAAKARDGTVWDEVVNLGYGGNEGQVDGEVVVNLATLLLTHMASQKLNQQRLETYLSASSTPSFDVTAHLENSQNGHRSPNPSKSNGTSTPRDLNTRLKLLELYTLHVLPQNNEWEYARDFINMSEVLDEERREAFVQALQSLREEKEHDSIREKELRKRQEEEMQQRRQDEERRRREEAKADEDKRRREAEERQRPPGAQPSQPARNRGTSASSSSRVPTQSSGQNNKQPPSSKARGPQKKPPPSPPPGLYRRATSLLALMQNTLLNAKQSMAKNPMVLLRLLLFLMAFAMAFARRDVRERIKRIVNDIWVKIRRTVGMGVKVSYI
ncbi:hypothetical protein MBLNU459_g7444t1 [Dothideomycetes sp. NU459]